MSNQWSGLVTTIQKFKKSVKDELDSKNQEFHAEINGDNPLSLFGLAAQPDERNEYLVDVSDVLFWHDPTAYIDELERWQGRATEDKYLSVKSYLNETEQNNVFSTFIDALKRNRLAPFVGAGFSKSCDMPLWGEAINKLITKLEGVSKSDERAMQPPLPFLKEAREHLGKWEYIEAAQLLYVNHRTQLESFIRNTFDLPRSKEIRGPINLLPHLAGGCIITTNFDGLIERVFNEKGKAIEGYMHGTQSQNQFASKLIQGDRCILKLHGHYDSANTYIFSQEQYDDAYGVISSLDYTKPLAKILRQIFISHSLLFLGCSLERDRTLELFINVVSSNAFDIPDHFAFLPEPNVHQRKIEKENLLSSAKIRPIWYKVNIVENQQDHSQLDDLLQFAIDCASGKVSL